ncbi:MAG: type VI secretion system contractile sheath large subunit [Proteobacteria bacterium]|nr:type VI secretion system contractile sheath large subunit [Pseudomonadota bacterium]MBU4294691.1 type VI secretion system contractile sheath large subunit [Pseudomonadota bacterium]MCG2749776.1 type VI secretion system contractile sheath large subunit [Desulfobulbaceae bacterium]
MPDPVTISEYDFAIVGDLQKRKSKPLPETPFRILLMGDFSCRTSRGTGDTARLRPVKVDRDNIDSVLNKMKVEIALPLAGNDKAPVTIGFTAMEDFHPDSIYQRLEIFAELRDMREGLDDPRALAALADELREPPSTAQPEMPPLEPPPAGGGLLDQIIDQTAHPSSRPVSPRPASQLDSFVREIVRPHLVAKAHPRQQEMIDAVDLASGELMRRIISHPHFQAAEAAWRGLEFLVARVETDDQLGVYLLDLSKDELAADLAGNSDLRKSAIFRLLVEEAVQTPGGEPWAVVAGCYTMGKNLADIGLLARMAQITGAAGAPFIAAASDRMLCGQSLHQTPDPDDWQPQAQPKAEEAWQLLRSLPEAQYVGLVLPRFLLRLPYGADTEPLDSMSFDELGEEGGHENYLWGNPCLACALLLGQAFSRREWAMAPGEVDEISNLPLHVYQKDGESQTLPCAEVVLTQRAAELIMDRGFMPLLSFLHQDRVRLARFQSIAEPLTRLAGPWD